MADDISGLGNLEGFDDSGKKEEKKKPVIVKKTGETPGKGKPGDEESLHKLIKEHREKAEGLEREKTELEKRARSLARIIEKVSAQPSQPSQPAVSETDIKRQVQEVRTQMNSDFEEKIKMIKDSVESLSKKLDEQPKDKVGSKVKDMVEETRNETNAKIKGIEDMIKGLEGKLTSRKGDDDVSKGLAAFGGTVEVKNDIISIRSELKRLSEELSDFRENMESRFSRVKIETKETAKIAPLEDRLDELVEKLGAENIEKLKKLVLSTEDLTVQVIPKEVRNKVLQEMTPVNAQMERMRNALQVADQRVKTLLNDSTYLKGEIKTLYKLGDYIAGLQKDRDETKKTLNDFQDMIRTNASEQKLALKGKAQELLEEIRLFQKRYDEDIEELLKKKFADLSSAALSSLKNETEKHLVIAREEVKEMSGRLLQNENVFKPFMVNVRDDLEKIHERMDKFKERQMEIEAEMDDKIEDKVKEFTGPGITKLQQDTVKILDVARDKVDSLEDRVGKAENAIRTEITLFRKDTNTIDKDLEKVSNRLSGFEDLVKTVRAENKDINQRLKAIQDIEESMEAIDQRIKEVDELKRRLEAKGDDIDSKMKDMKASLAEQSKLFRLVDSNDKEIGDVGRQVKLLEGKISQAMKEIDEDKREMEEMVGELKDEKSQFENTLVPTINLFKDDMDKFGKKIESLRENDASIKDDLKEVRDMAKRAGAKADDIPVLTKDVSALKDKAMEIDVLKQRIFETYKRNTDSLKRFKDEVSSLKEAVVEIRENRKMVKDVQSSVSALDKKLSLMNEDLSRVKSIFEQTVRESLLDRKKLADDGKKRKDRINRLLGDLGG